MPRNQETLISDGEVHLPFGYELFSERVNSDPSEISAPAIDSLRQKVIATKNQSREALKRINLVFEHNDHQAYLDSKTGDKEAEQFGQLTDWLANTSEYNIARFALWNMSRTRQLAQALQRDKSELDDHALNEIDKLSSTGLLPATAVDVYCKKTQQSGEFWPIDSIKRGGYGIEASYRPATDQISLSNMYADRGDMQFITPAMHSVVLHEKTHSLTPEYKPYCRTGIPLWLNEACASHLQYATLTGQADIVNPRLRDKPNETGYRSERHLMAQLLDGAGVAVDGLYRAIITKDELAIEDINVLIENYFNKTISPRILRYQQFEQNYAKAAEYKDRVELVDRAIDNLIPGVVVFPDQAKSRHSLRQVEID